MTHDPEVDAIVNSVTSQSIQDEKTHTKRTILVVVAIVLVTCLNAAFTLIGRQNVTYVQSCSNSLSQQKTELIIDDLTNIGTVFKDIEDGTKNGPLSKAAFDKILETYLVPLAAHNKLRQSLTVGKAC